MKKDEIKSTLIGILGITTLGIFGVFILFLTGFFYVRNFNDLYTYIYNCGFEAIISFFFIGITIYVWIFFFINIVLKPKEEVLYLLKIEGNTGIFINKKGKIFRLKGCKLKEKEYYVVLKTRDILMEVVESSLETFTIPKEKKSYWLNFYSPKGNYEGIFLLPIVYVILLPGLLSFIMAKGFAKIYGFIWSLVPVYIIIYDLIYKIKLNKSEGNEIDDSRLINSYFILIDTIKIFVIICINVISIYLFMHTNDNNGRIFLSVFCLCALCALGQIISEILGNEKATRIFKKSYVVIFLIYWFGFLIVCTSLIIKQGIDYVMLLFTIPFWAVGLCLLYDTFYKNN